MIVLLLALTASASSEEEVWAAYEEGEFLTAGRLADELLEVRPRSLQGNFVKGYVLWKEEGEHAGAKHYLDRADDIYWKVNPSNGADGPWQVHNQIMGARIDIASEMGNPELQLELIARYNELFSPDLQIERAWPLMKLGRFRQAREVALAFTESEETWERGSALNSLCAIESEAQQRVAGYEWCLKALEHERSLSLSDVTVDANNAAMSATGILDFDASLELAREATTGSSMGVANPFQTLVTHHTRAARGADALEAVAGLVDWRARQPASMRDLARSGTDAILAQFLLAAGRPERSRELIDRTIIYPDRAGLTSSEPLQAEGRHAAMRLAIRRLQAERAREVAASTGRFATLTHWLGSWLPDTGVWEDRATLRAALTDSRRLRTTFRVYMDGGLGLEPWLMTGLVEDLGQGVYLAAVEDAALSDSVVDESPPATLLAIDAYYEAFQLSAAYHRGDAAEVLQLSDCVERLPPAEVLLKAQLYAMIGEAAFGRQGEAASLPWFGKAMQADPGSLRRLGIALPARISAGSGDGVTEDVATQLERSPRLRSSNSGFSVVVTGAQSAVEICLRDPFGAQLSCSAAGPIATAEGEEAPSEWALASHHVLTWSERAFALPTGSSSIDLDSLDGSTLKSGALEAERIDRILDGM